MTVASVGASRRRCDPVVVCTYAGCACSAVHSSIWTAIFHSGDIMRDLQRGLSDLEKAVQYLVSSGIDAAIAEAYAVDFLELQQVRVHVLVVSVSC